MLRTKTESEKLPQRSVAFIIGSRPELIKLAPVIAATRERAGLVTSVVFTGQHRDLLDQVARHLNVRPDFDLDVMRPDQTLPQLTARIVTALDPVIGAVNPAIVVVQGDTTSAFAGALASFYRRLPVAHVEAGLRSLDRFRPFPEEVNRRLTSVLADVHFAPTQGARHNLLQEGIPDDAIHVTGNTVVDAVRQLLESAPEPPPGADWTRPVILVTVHRRENLGDVLRNLVGAIRRIAFERPDVQIIWPVHPRREIRDAVSAELADVANVRIFEPLDYPQFVAAMKHSTLVLTDSGGVQEEAPTVGVPVLVLRDVTERPEGIDAGVALLVGTQPERIVAETLRLLSDAGARARLLSESNPYGDGHAGKRIAALLDKWLNTRATPVRN